jgi:hypothetical protein
MADSFWDTIGESAEDAWGSISSFFTDDKGNLDWTRIGTTGGALLSAAGVLDQSQPGVGYQGGIPDYTAVRSAVDMTEQPKGLESLAQRYSYDPNRRPGSSGQRYFSDTQYAAPEGLAAAKAESDKQAALLSQFNKANPAREGRKDAAREVLDRLYPKKPASGESLMVNPKVTMAQGGGVRNLYLGGSTDGMADKVPATIDGQQQAALSDGEFIVPADVVSHLGNGNSNAGAEQLYGMMDKIRKDRTGTTKQGTQINPNNYLPR